MNAIVLCAGYGNRLRPLTDNIPKCLVRVNRFPVLFWIFCALRKAHIRKVRVNLLSRFADEKLPLYRERPPDVTLEPWPLGSASSVAAMMGPKLKTVVVAYGDVLWNWPLHNLLWTHSWDTWGAHANRDSEHVTMALHRSTKPWNCGVATLGEQNRIVRFMEKPEPRDCESQWVNAGVMIFPRSATCLIPKHAPCPDIARDWIPALIRVGYPVYGYCVPKEAMVLDIGTPAALALADKTWNYGHPKSGS